MLEPMEADENGQDYNQKVAIKGYWERTGRTFVPGQMVEIPTDALVFTDYQQVWTTVDDYRKGRCHSDPETNEELVYYVTHELLDPELPPVYVDITDDGVALVDGVHRTTAALIANQPTIYAYLNGA